MQILIPLVAELAPPEKRAVSISIVGTGPTLAILLARILSGIVAQYTAWRNVYFLSLGMQVVVIVLLYCFMPDYPAINHETPRGIFRTYPGIVAGIPMLLCRHPALVQVGMVVFCTMFCVSSYWTTLTFLLAGKPYEYSTLLIGLFGLIGAVTLVAGPLFARYLIQPMGNPLASAGVGKVISLVGIVVGTVVGKNVAGPVVQALLLDAGLMVTFISCRMVVNGVEPLKRNRVNAAFVILMYLGSLAGTKAGNEVFARFGGWEASGGLSVGVIVLGMGLIAIRGPNEKGWVGWRGGWRVREETVESEKEDVEVVLEREKV